MTNGILTAEELDALLDRLMEEMSDEAIQRSFTEDRTVDGKTVRGTHKGYNTTGYGYQWAVDRFNAVVGLAHWHVTQGELARSEYKAQSGQPMWDVVTEVTILLGNWGMVEGKPAFIPLASRTNWGTHQARALGDAIKGAWTNGFKKCAALYGVGSQAWRNELDDDLKAAPDAEAGKKVRKEAGDMLRGKKGQNTSAEADATALRKALGILCTEHKVNRYGLLVSQFRTLSSKPLNELALTDIVRKLRGDGVTMMQKLCPDCGSDAKNFVQAVLTLAEAQDTDAGNAQEGRADRVAARLDALLGAGWMGKPLEELKVLAQVALCSKPQVDLKALADEVKRLWLAEQKHMAPKEYPTWKTVQQAMNAYAQEGKGKPLSEFDADDWSEAKSSLSLGLIDVLTGLAPQEPPAGGSLT